MFNRLNSRNKKIIVNGMVALAAMLFVIAFFIGKSIEEKPVNADSEKRDKVLQYSQPAKPIQKEENNEIHIHEKYEFEDPVIDKAEGENDELPLTLADLHSAEDIQASKKAAELFIRAFYPFDGNNPLQHIEKAQSYMTKQLFQQHYLNPARPTHHTFKKRLEDIEIREPFEPSRDYIAWDVIVSGSVEDTVGNQSKETAWFLLKIVKEDGVFKVSALALNKPH